MMLEGFLPNDLYKQAETQKRNAHVSRVLNVLGIKDTGICVQYYGPKED